MSLDDFRARPMQRFTANFWNSFLDVLKGMNKQTMDEILRRVRYEDLSSLGYSIVPDRAGTRDLGSADRPWGTVYANVGEFADSVYIQGKPAIKDGDPITVSDISDSVRDKVTQAIDGSNASKVSEVGLLVLHAYTNTPLGANDTWTSSVDEDPRTGRIVGTVYTNVDGTLYVEQSPDGSNWDAVDVYQVTGGSGVKFSVEKVCMYARVRYVNGSSGQSVFRLYVYKRLRVV